MIAANTMTICNMALGHLGVLQTISSLDEKSQEAIACKRFWDVCRESTLRDFTWPFATRFETLELVEEQPTSEWLYSYRYPNDCLFVRRIFSGVRNDDEGSMIRYLVGADDNGQLIFTDQEDAEIEFTHESNVPARWPVDFVLAASLHLAALIAPSVTKGDPNNLAKKNMDNYMLRIGRAVSNSKNEQARDPQPMDSFTRSRL
jgi:hypothetical protein